MKPTLYARLSLDGLAHRVRRDALGIDEALERAYRIGAVDQSIHDKIDKARSLAKQLTETDGKAENTRTGT